jgi:DNA adenine methylase
LKTIIKRYGGKWNLAKWILEFIPEHTTYLEPFCGSAAVLFQKEPSKAEFINDLDERIINAFKVIRSEPEQLAAILWATPYSSENWRNEPKTDMEAAALFIAASSQFYAGATGTSTFSVDRGHANKNKAAVWADWFLRVLPAAARLKNVQLLKMDAIEFIDKFRDREDFIFYVDPPYLGHESEYCCKVDYPALVDCLNSVKGKVIVSEHARAKDYFMRWNVKSRVVTSRCRTGKGQIAKKNEEFLFLNF